MLYVHIEVTHNEHVDIVSHSYCIVSLVSCPKNISAVKKGKSKKVQVAERLKDVISL